MSIDEIAIKIRTARKNASMTQAEAAARLGITYQAISNYERGVTRIDTDTLIKLCAVYDVPVSEILGTSSSRVPADSQMDKIIDQLVQTSERYTAYYAPNHTETISDSEARLLSLLRNLNAEGQEKLLDYAEDLAASGRYIKTDAPDMVQKQA